MAREINSIADLTPDDRNANKGTERGNAFIERSLRQYGAGRSILIDKNGKIIAGNKTIENAAVAGLDGLVVVQTDGTKIVAVQRTDLDMDADPRARELALADNRAGDLNLEWDGPILAELGREIDLAPFFSTDELAEIVGEQAGGSGADAPDAQVDKADELREKWQTAKGQVWEIPSASVEGNHRLMCGDATGGDVDALLGSKRADLVFTDPPYGVEYEGGHNEKKREQIKGDALSGAALTDLFYRALLSAVRVTKDTTPFYIWFASGKSVETFAAFGKLPLTLRAVIQWYKVQSGLGAFMSQYIPNCEPCMYAHKTGHAPKWYGPTDEKTVWELKREGTNEYHPTQKPPQLAGRAIKNSSVIGDVVLDVFLGSGATMVAAEQLGRLCYGMEIEPKYVAVALERMADMGLTPKLVEECKSVAVAE